MSLIKIDQTRIADKQRAEANAARAAAYRDEADPLFFKVQRGEAPEQEWLDKVAEIRARYPYPEGET
jgi:hypothetical protein